MKVRLLCDARIKHSKGEIVNVSPEEFNFLTSTRQAVPAIETPEVVIAEKIETPERKKRKK